MKLLRMLIREMLQKVYEKKVILEPDLIYGDGQDEGITLGGGSVRGHTGPITTADPTQGKTKKEKKKKKKSSVPYVFDDAEHKE